MRKIYRRKMKTSKLKINRERGIGGRCKGRECGKGM